MNKSIKNGQQKKPYWCEKYPNTSIYATITVFNKIKPTPLKKRNRFVTLNLIFCIAIRFCTVAQLGTVHFAAIIILLFFFLKSIFRATENNKFIIKKLCNHITSHGTAENYVLDFSDIGELSGKIVTCDNRNGSEHAIKRKHLKHSHGNIGGRLKGKLTVKCKIPKYGQDKCNKVHGTVLIVHNLCKGIICFERMLNKRQFNNYRIHQRKADSLNYTCRSGKHSKFQKLQKSRNALFLFCLYFLLIKTPLFLYLFYIIPLII